MVKPFAEAVVALKPGEYTHTPVQTQFGWQSSSSKRLATWPRRRSTGEPAARADGAGPKTLGLHHLFEPLAHLIEGRRGHIAGVFELDDVPANCVFTGVCVYWPGLSATSASAKGFTMRSGVIQLRSPP